MVGDPVDFVDPYGLVDINLIPTNEIMHERANNIFTIASHGYGGLLTLEDVAKKAKASGKSEILLIACNQGGEQKDFMGNDAQNLANLSNMPVQYSTNQVAIVPYLSIPFSFDFPWKTPWRYAYPRKKY